MPALDTYYCEFDYDSILVALEPITPSVVMEPQRLKIEFKRTIRVPENSDVAYLPPDLGSFPLFEVCDYDSKLPPEMVAKGGAFLPMYQREAMWINFETDHPFMIKVFAGGVNAVSGESSVEDDRTKMKQPELAEQEGNIQDYVVTPAQLWLDGIATSPGIVKQFVAMPVGQGYSVEAQILGEEAVGGLQFEITPVTPEYNGVRPPIPDGDFVLFIINTIGRTFTLACSPTSKIDSIRFAIGIQGGIIPDRLRLIWHGYQLEDGRTLSDYRISKVGGILYGPCILMRT